MINASLDQCLSFIHSQTASVVVEPGVRRAVTISRQAGCGAVIVAEALARQLQERAPLPSGATWTVFDRDLMNKVLDDHNLPAYLEKFLPEDRISQIEDTLADIFGLRPTVDTLIQQTAETLMKLVGLGGVILIGRAGNIVTAKMPNVLHVRLVAPLEDRIARIGRDDRKTPDDACKFCLEEEQARTRYLKTYFNADINDPLHYHLVINTSLMGYENAAKLIADAVLKL
jgi:cytidylate kinase